MASCILVHDVIDDLAHLLLAVFKHLNLLLHQLSLPVHKRLWYDIDILGLHELLPHLVQEGIHLVVRGLRQLCLMVLHDASDVRLL